jgi:site-specific recombinase XerD
MYWVRFFVRWHGLKHPRDMGSSEVEGFLTMLATERKVSASTHNQALSALLFLYREVLGITLPWLDNLNRPTRARRIPSVLTKDEVAGLLAALEGKTALLARLRIKDVDFERHVISVREAKGNKDRVVMLPAYSPLRCGCKCLPHVPPGRPTVRHNTPAFKCPTH